MFSSSTAESIYAYPSGAGRCGPRKHELGSLPDLPLWRSHHDAPFHPSHAVPSTTQTLSAGRETARLLQHWRHHQFSDVRPFFCQAEAMETAIRLTEVAPESASGKRILDHHVAANKDANPELLRFALKLATGAGKTTVMAMLIAWQTINAVRRSGSKRFTRGFLVVAPGLTFRDRLRVLQPNDPDSYYASRELVPGDMLDDIHRAKIVITNCHAFKFRERVELSAGGRALLQGRGDVAGGPARLPAPRQEPAAAAPAEGVADSGVG
jgi:type III restriction enzyme